MKITIFGSIAVYAAIKEAEAKLIALGHKVVIPELEKELPLQYGGEKKLNFNQYIEQNGGMEAFPPSHEIWKLKHAAITHYFPKIEWSDVCLVVNATKNGIEGYIGGNTLIELGVALYLRKPLFIQYPIPDSLTYKTEILAMQPRFIGNDLSLIV